MRRLVMVKEGNRVVGSTRGESGFVTGREEEAAGTEEEIAYIGPASEEVKDPELDCPADFEPLLEWEEFPLGGNIRRKKHSRSLTEASDVMYRIMKLAAMEVGISPDELAGRVNARLKLDRKKRRWENRLVQGDEDAWADRI